MITLPYLDQDHLVKVVSVAGLTVIGVVALSRGLDGPLLVGISAVIGGIAGYSVKTSTSQEVKP